MKLGFLDAILNPATVETPATPTQDAVALVEAKKKKAKQEKIARIIVLILMGIVLCTGIYFMTRTE